jgi:hypothetical protein
MSGKRKHHSATGDQPANSDRRIETLRRKAKRDEVEVEDLLAIAAAGDAKAIPVLLDLKCQYAWPEDNHIGKSRVVPLGLWQS